MRMLVPILFMLGFLPGLGAQANMIVQSSLPTYPLGFHPTRPRFYFWDYQTVKVVDLQQAEVTILDLPGIKVLAFSPDTQFTLIGSYSDSSFILVLNEDGQLIRTITTERALSTIKISESNQYFLTESENQISVFSMKDGLLVNIYHKPKERFNIGAFNGNRLVVYEDNQLVWLSLPSLKITEHSPVKGDFVKFSEYGDFYFCIDNNQLNIYKTANQQLADSIPDQSFSGFFDNLPSISPDGKRIAVSNFMRGDPSLRIYQLKTGKQTARLNSTEESNSLTGGFKQIDPAWRFYGFINKNNGTTILDLSTGKEVCEMYSYFPNGFLIKTPDNYYMANRQGAFEGVTFEQNGKLYDFDQFDPYFNRPDLVLTRLHQTPPAAIELFEKAWKKRMNLLGLAEHDLPSPDESRPEVQFVSELPVFTNQTELDITVSARDPHFPLDRLALWVNGVPIYGRNGYSLRASRQQAIRQRLNVPLVPGDNTIVIEAYNFRGMRSLHEQRTVRCEASPEQPDLYVVAIGVSSYDDRDKNLPYAATDARSLAALLASNRGTFRQVFVDTLINAAFSSAGLSSVKRRLEHSRPIDHVVVFFAGHGLVDEAFDYYLGTSTVDFKNPARGGLPYAELEALFDGAPARQRLLLIDACFSGEIDKETVERIRTENTRSGPVVFRSSDTVLHTRLSAAERVFNLVHEWFVDLRAGNGATVLSSATGLQPAAEGDRWQDGVFTWCLLNGLRDGKADLNHDGAILVSELQAYLLEAVPQQTEGQQQPTFRMENRSNDFRVW